MPTCKCGAKTTYSNLCYSCRTKKEKNEIVEVKQYSEHVQWYTDLITKRKNQYTTSEIHTAFDLLWLDVKAKVHPQDKWKFNTASFSELLKMAWSMVDVPYLFNKHIEKIRSEHVPGNGWEMLESLGFIKPVEGVEEIPW